jgi:hypothetical protein
MTEARFLIKDQARVENICRIGQREKCCRYLGAGAEGFECFKHQPAFASMVDARAAIGAMVAVSDNCEGVV